ncbi:hypothetical protein GCM10027285_09560 [Oleiagrimonas citrea]|jgi:hypothetical protein|uniref:TonB-dependent receptor n=1 Tax=Oleiagrimonas citrea TaxID=1665687 RepID=A0A846ZJW8_9GAMM|nr:TonB-dependent receptor [Oleiagrimonas citrea]NKZ38484.1 TonB-dependent receptor [Oleiagrimonas citrea]
MNYDRKFLLWALGFAVFGLCVGIYMAASKNHGQLVAHAHILLVGFVVSFIYAIIHKLWLTTPGRWIARIQFWLHIVCAALLSIGLLLLYGHVYPETVLEPILSLGSIGVLLGMLLMGVMVLRSSRAGTSAT